MSTTQGQLQYRHHTAVHMGCKCVPANDPVLSSVHPSPAGDASSIVFFAVIRCVGSWQCTSLFHVKDMHAGRSCPCLIRTIGLSNVFECRGSAWSIDTWTGPFVCLDRGQASHLYKQIISMSYIRCFCCIIIRL